MVALLAEGVDRNELGGAQLQHVRQSPSSRRAWIEIELGGAQLQHVRSPSSRRAWIEMTKKPDSSSAKRVALLAEGVDRNLLLDWIIPQLCVALLAEGVDRNISSHVPAQLES